MRGEAKRACLARLVAGARVEVLPTPSAEDLVLAHLPRTRVVTVTASPRKGLENTIAFAERLARQGYPVVPHLAARMVSGRSELTEIVARLTEHGITRVFVPAGDADPAGDYHDALGLLEDLAALGHPFTQVGITGYPESHPSVHDAVTVQAMWDKRRFATHIVSNLTFDAAALGRWVDRLRARGVTLPVLLGVPGPVHRTKLLAMAGKIGVSDSARFLAKNGRFFGRLVAPGPNTGEKFVDRSVAALRPDADVAGLHVYSFNQIAETEAWLVDLERRWSA